MSEQWRVAGGHTYRGDQWMFPDEVVERLNLLEAKAKLADRQKAYLESVVEPLDPRTSRQTCIDLRLNSHEKDWLRDYDAMGGGQ